MTYQGPEAGRPRRRSVSGGPRTYGSVSRDQVPLRSPDGPLRARLEPRPPADRSADRRGPVARFVDRFGWRAYALPVLGVATILGLGNIAANGASQPTHQQTAIAPSTTGGTSAVASQPSRTPSPTPKATPKPTATLPTTAPTGSVAALPVSAATYPERGNDTFNVVPGTSQPVGHGPLRTYAVETEGAMSGVDAQAFAASVVATLSDPRSWSHGGIRLQRVDSGHVDFRVTLTSVLTIRKKCGYSLPVETSCFNSAEGRAFINVARWVRGAVTYGKDVADYRHYVVNHEVGHALGHGHVKCPKAGAAAPIMMEQTLGVTTPGVGACQPNPWPYVNGKLATGPPTAGY